MGSERNNTTVVLGADHNGVALKKEIKKLLSERGYQCVDIGPYTDAEKVDYVDFARTVGQIVNDGEAKYGVLICGTGVGMSIAVNRFPGVRGSLAHSVAVAEKTREHNDANVLCLGAWVNSAEENLKITETWLAGKFGEGRHVRRVEKLKEYGAEKIVFTNGVFDVVHPGHIELLRFAKSLGGKLVVAINSDRAVKELKGPSRPVNSETERKKVLEQLKFVDEVVIFDDTATGPLIDKMRPHVVVKGAEWTAEEVRKRDNIPAHIEVRVFPLVISAAGEKYSTSGVIRKITEGNVAKGCK